MSVTYIIENWNFMDFRTHSKKLWGEKTPHIAASANNIEVFRRSHGWLGSQLEIKLQFLSLQIPLPKRWAIFIPNRLLQIYLVRNNILGFVFLMHNVHINSVVTACYGWNVVRESNDRTRKCLRSRTKAEKDVETHILLLPIQKALQPPPLCLKL